MNSHANAIAIAFPNHIHDPLRDTPNREHQYESGQRWAGLYFAPTSVCRVGWYGIAATHYTQATSVAVSVESRQVSALFWTPSDRASMLGNIVKQGFSERTPSTQAARLWVTP
ncbi:MAG: hypothetical protein ACYC0X_12210 [Pirellulaceae bacterium]